MRHYCLVRLFIEENCIRIGLFVKYRTVLLNVKLELVAVYKKVSILLGGVQFSNW